MLCHQLSEQRFENSMDASENNNSNSFMNPWLDICMLW